jgi:hypothetical protein
LFIGTAKLSVAPGTKGLAETSNIPRTALGRGASFSRKGYCTMEPQPAQKGQLIQEDFFQSHVHSICPPPSSLGAGENLTLP